MNKKADTSSKTLFDEVIDPGLCIFCGACAGGCPYLASSKGKIRLLDNCTLSEGQCYQYCPRTDTDMDALSRRLFGGPYGEDELGTTMEVLTARSTDQRVLERAQYGGTVTTIISLALEEGLIDRAILTKTSGDKTPMACLARSREEVLQCTGSNYSATPVLEILNRIPKESEERLGVVVTPCQALALAKMREDPPENRVGIDHVKLVVGLFCTWGLSPNEFQRFLKDEFDLHQVVKFDIPPPPANQFDVYMPSGKVSIPLDQIREFIMPGCTFCLDMTSEFADISVGSVEGMDSWNTVIVRTERGAELMERAKAKELIETGTLPPLNLAHLKESAVLKKKRAIKEILKKNGDRRDLRHIGLPEKVINKLLG